MTIAIYGQRIDPVYQPDILRLLQLLNKHNIRFFIHKTFLACLPEFHNTQEEFTALPSGIDCVISLGGDGTFLESVRLVGNSGIPVLGINIGRLGFLSTVPLDKMEDAMDALLQQKYDIEERTLLKASGSFLPSEVSPYALNEIGIQRHYPSVISIRLTINEETLPDYWADGLLIATPTGSTAYSMSVGGPIVVPDSKSFIISPIASHNLNIRPLVISDDAKLNVQAITRKGTAIFSVDNRLHEVDSGAEMHIQKANFTAKTIRLHGNSFFTTLHEKLSWGIDKRNIHY
jgi:NAD+ kinase